MKEKRKIKTVYKYREPKEYLDKKVKQEISQLEEKKSKLGGGFINFFRKGAINKEINERKSILSTQKRISLEKQNVSLGRTLLEKEKIKNQLKKAKQQSQVNFKPITMEDLYS